MIREVFVLGAVAGVITLAILIVIAVVAALQDLFSKG